MFLVACFTPLFAVCQKQMGFSTYTVVGSLVVFSGYRRIHQQSLHLSECSSSLPTKRDSRSAGVNRSRTKQALSSQFPGGRGKERKDKFITFPSPFPRYYKHGERGFRTKKFPPFLGGGGNSRQGARDKSASDRAPFPTLVFPARSLSAFLFFFFFDPGNRTFCLWRRRRRAGPPTPSS